MILNTIKNFGKIINLGGGYFENVLNKSKIIENEEQVKMLKEWLPYENKENIKCKLLYDAKRDGDDIPTFHKLCDDKGATLTLIATSDNKKIGGFYLNLSEEIKDLLKIIMLFYSVLIIMKNILP